VNDLLKSFYDSRLEQNFYDERGHIFAERTQDFVQLWLISGCNIWWSFSRRDSHSGKPGRRYWSLPCLLTHELLKLPRNNICLIGRTLAGGRGRWTTSYGLWRRTWNLRRIELWPLSTEKISPRPFPVLSVTLCKMWKSHHLLTTVKRQEEGKKELKKIKTCAPRCR